MPSESVKMKTLASAKDTERMDALLSGMVDSGFTAGISAYVEKAGKQLYRGVFGQAVIEEKRPIGSDTIFQIFSMSKAITSAAALILFERGLYRMYDPVSKFIPEFKDPKVLDVGRDGVTHTRPAIREIQIRDLFSMTSGIPYPDNDTLVEKQLKRLFARLESKARQTDNPISTLDVIKAVAGVPLAFDPGTGWKYGFSLDIIGALVEVWSGKKLGVFLKEEILDPLHMVDTGFHVPEDKWNRFASMYPAGKDDKIRPRRIDNDTEYNAQPSFESGGGGLVSTVDDYAAFARMLLTGKTPEGIRILGRKTIDLMRSNHLTPEQAKTFNWDTQYGYGYGLGVRTLLDPAMAGCSGSVGEFGWDGYAGTWFCVDPAEDLIAVFMTQRSPGGLSQSVPLFKAALYALL